MPSGYGELFADGADTSCFAASGNGDIAGLSNYSMGQEGELALVFQRQVGQAASCNALVGNTANAIFADGVSFIDPNPVNKQAVSGASVVNRTQPGVRSHWRLRNGLRRPIMPQHRRAANDNTHASVCFPDRCFMALIKVQASQHYIVFPKRRPQNAKYDVARTGGHQIIFDFTTKIKAFFK